MAEDGYGNQSRGVSLCNARFVLCRHHRTTSSEVSPRVGRILVGGSKVHLAHLLHPVSNNNNNRRPYNGNISNNLPLGELLHRDRGKVLRLLTLRLS